MKKFFAIATSLCLTIMLSAQELPIQSPKSTLEQRIGLTDTKITYWRPSVKNREIFGSVVPNGSHWRLGANGSTLLEISSMFVINDHKIDAGIYSLSMVCEDDQWTLIINSDIEGWGTYNHDPKRDLARISENVVDGPFVETMTINWGNLTEFSADLFVCWESKCATYKFTFPTEQLALLNIKEALVRSDADWKTYRNAAKFALGRDNMNGQSWALRAFDLNPTDWYINYLNAQYAKRNNLTKEAKKFAKKALELGQMESKMAQKPFENEEMIVKFIDEL
jgi:hypothetical protein